MREPDSTHLLSVDQAIQIIDNAPLVGRTQLLPLLQARDLTLAADLHFDRDDPPFDKSLMDGFAVRSADVLHDNATLIDQGEIPAGASVPVSKLQPGQCCAIMTGAPIPPGCDGIVPVEETTRNENQVTIGRAQGSPDKFILRQATHAAVDSLAIASGTTLGPAQIALAATIGAAQVNVHLAPTIAILSTGDEIVPHHQSPAASQIRNANSPMLNSLLSRLSPHITDLGHVSDDPAQITHRLTMGLQHDFLFVTGGMSMGTHDHVPRLLAELGLQLKITKLRIKPGKPFVFAQSDDARQNVFGLPGNPLSGFVCTLILARRLIRRFMHQPPAPRWITAALAQDLPSTGPRQTYSPARVDFTNPQMPVAHPLDWKGSADLFTLSHANALICRNENDVPRPAGSTTLITEF